MNKDELNLKQIDKLLKQDDYNGAKNYIKKILKISDDEALNYLYEYISSNDISIKKLNAKDIETGYKKILFNFLFIGFNFVLILSLSYYILRNMGKSINVLLIIVLALLNLVFGVYFIILLLDIIGRKTIKISGKYTVFTSGPKLYMNYLLKFEDEVPIIISRKNFETLRDFNYCEVEKFKYSKILKNIRNIKNI